MQFAPINHNRTGERTHTKRDNMLLVFTLVLFTSSLTAASWPSSGNFRSAAATATGNIAKPGCQTQCGNLTVRYPFGIGIDKGCSIGGEFDLDCNSTVDPPKLYIQATDIEIYNISDYEMRVLNPVAYICYNESGDITDNFTAWTDLIGTPFSFSQKNKFTVIGCDDFSLITGTNGADFSTGCFGLCSKANDVPEGYCSGIGCCQTSIPKGLKFYNATVVSLRNHARVVSFNPCGFAFLGEEDSFKFRGARDLSNATEFFDRTKALVPIVLDWVIGGNRSCAEATECKGNSSCNDAEIGGYRCSCNEGYEGNPYLDPGCQDINECDNNSHIRCYGHCINLEGSYNCTCWPGYKGDATTPDGCQPLPSGSKFPIMAFTLGVSMGTLFLAAIIFALYKVIKRTKVRRRRRRFFKRNGGLLLKQQEEADPSLVDKTIHFTSRELEKATDDFNENRILGHGGQGTVYKGMLADGRIVAVKKSKIVDENQLEQFINEVVILSQVNHRNVVKLLGCCLETEVPLLVSEFISNGTLYEHIHNEADGIPLSLNLRLQIATEVAGALAYLHSSTSIPIYHRDIKTTNILLDDKYRAKVSDFGTSRFVSMDQTHLTTLVKGTFGYLDPEYFQSSQFTEKSDVYSFGVVLLELLTSERPISLTRFGENRSLATHFMLAMEEGRVMSIFDVMVIKESTRDELMMIANLAMRCLNLNGKNRPTMKEVTIELETIRASHVPSVVQTNIRQVGHGEELIYGKSTSTVMSFEDNTSQ